MAGEWFTQYHPKDGSIPEPQRIFPDFGDMLAYVRAFLQSDTPGALHIHTPPRATDNEREQLRACGAILT